MATKHLGKTPSQSTELALYGQIGSGGSTGRTTAYSDIFSMCPQWQDALAQRATSPAVAVFLGDSLTEGQGASTRAQRWLDVAAYNLRNLHPTGINPGGHEYYPSFDLVQSPDSPWTTVATTGTVTQYQTMGLGLHSSYMNSAGSITFTVLADTVDLFYYTFPAGGSFSYSVDGAAATTVSCVSSSDLPAGGRLHLAVNPGTVASHTVKITWVSGNVIFHGIAAYQLDYSSGIQIWNAGRYGAVSGNFVATTDTGTANGTTTGAAHNASVAALTPDLVVIELGANDWLSGSYDPSYTQANLQTLITQCAAYAAPPDVLLLSLYEVNPSQTTSTHAWSEYVAVMDTLANNNANVYHLDMFSKFRQPMQSDLLRTSDNRHPNNYGHQIIAQYATESLIPVGEVNMMLGGTL